MASKFCVKEMNALPQILCVNPETKSRTRARDESWVQAEKTFRQEVIFKKAS